jgi:Ca2+-transporting ATPase
MEPWYKQTPEEVLAELKSSPGGLQNSHVLLLQQQFGKNELKETKRKSKLSIFFDQFKDIMIVILLIAAGVSFVVGEHTDALVIVAIIIANAWMGYSQEYNAEESVRMLQKMSAQQATVLRQNNPSKMDAADLVPGDIILLEAGDIIPADGRLLEVHTFKTEEAALTGESHAVEKIIASIQGEKLSQGDQVNMIFKGTMVSNGSAKAVVTATGMNTEIGKIAGMMDVGEQTTPLQKRLAVFSKQLAVIVIVICILVFVFGTIRGEPGLSMFLTALSLAVAALPEALPAVITIALARAAKKMVTHKALMRALPAMETLGSVTYICSDKTGTLTQNKMTVEKFGAEQGKGTLLLQAMMLNNEVRFSDDGTVMGDSTETALVDYALRNGITKPAADKQLPLVAKLPFDSVRMRMSTLHEYEDKWLLMVKGAPVKILEILSPNYLNRKQGYLDRNRQWAAEGLRVLFFAYKIFDEKPGQVSEELEKDMEFLGMVAMIDPPREEVIAAINECKTAGIKTVMITGDQPLTAHAIAKRLHMIEEDNEKTYTGVELANMPEEQFRQEVGKIFVYARVNPEQKLNIVKALQTNGEFVAMTGDGVNDAPSLKQADIGVAMGITGTDVSKEAADMILLDDNFATIVKAVKEGRRIYENIKKFILYVLSCNLAEILTIFFAPIFGLPIPLLPIHILWINLVTDGLPGLALTAEPAEKNIMKKPPRPPKENLFAGGLAAKILLSGTLMAAAVIATQAWTEARGYDVQTQQTMVFTLLCFIQLGNALSVRSSDQSIFTKSLFRNRAMWAAIVLTVILQTLIVYLPFSEVVFKTTALDLENFAVILFVTLATLLGIELIKFLLRKKPKITDNKNLIDRKFSATV